MDGDEAQPPRRRGQAVLKIYNPGLPACRARHAGPQHADQDLQLRARDVHAIPLDILPRAAAAAARVRGRPLGLEREQRRHDPGRSIGHRNSDEHQRPAAGRRHHGRWRYRARRSPRRRRRLDPDPTDQQQHQHRPCVSYYQVRGRATDHRTTRGRFDRVAGPPAGSCGTPASTSNAIDASSGNTATAGTVTISEPGRSTRPSTTRP